IEIPWDVTDARLGGESGCRLLPGSKYCSVERPSESTPRHVTSTLHLRLLPRRDNRGFSKKRDTAGKGVGFYASYPGKNTPSYIAKHFISNSIEYVVKVPDGIFGAVQEAVVYWNRIFGYQAITLRHFSPQDDLWEPYVNSIVFLADLSD